MTDILKLETSPKQVTFCVLTHLISMRVTGPECFLYLFGTKENSSDLFKTTIWLCGQGVIWMFLFNVLKPVVFLDYILGNRRSQQTLSVSRYIARICYSV